MKPSAFNYVAKGGDGEIVVYNTLNKSFVSLEPHEYEALDTNAVDALGNECVSALYDNGFLVDDHINELDFLKYQFEKTRYSTETLAVTIAPTLDCNFKCAYCYESTRAGMMSDNDFDLVLGFIRTNHVESPFKKLQINWYGGEPMLCIESIVRWSKRLIRFCEEHCIEYASHMITNGSLINAKNISMLKECHIGNVQVTIDGWGQEHDRRRPSKDGECKFDTIVKAVEGMGEADIEVSVRMNVDANNIADYNRLADYFSNKRNVYVHVGHLRDYESLPMEVYSCFGCDEFSRAEFELFEQSGYTIEDLKNVFSTRRVFCGACTENSYVIDEKLNVYKCWNEIGDDECIIFNLREEEESRLVNYAVLCKYMAWNPLEDEVCSACVWMPICGGGCAFESGKLDRRFCYPPVYTIDKYLDLYLKEVIRDESNQES